MSAPLTAASPTWLTDLLVDVEDAAMNVQRLSATPSDPAFATALRMLRQARRKLVRAVATHTPEGT